MRDPTPDFALRRTTDIDVDMHARAVLAGPVDDELKRRGYLSPVARVVDFALSPPDVVAADLSESHSAARFLIEEYINGFVG
jgi:hypothetical protein